MTCDWPLLGCDTCCDLDVPPDVQEAAEAAAIDWLWNATNRRFGNCPVDILPCMARCDGGYGSWPAFVPYRTRSGWVNVGCGRCTDSCSCSAISSFILPTVGDVLAITSDGVPLPPEAYVVYNHREVVRADGGTWPTCQDFTDPSFVVTYTPGYPVPSMGQLAAATLACQLARRACGAKCDLPANTTAVSRQGITITLDPSMNTGLWVVDQWIELANRPVSKVWSPDVPSTRVLPTTVS